MGPLFAAFEARALLAGTLVSLPPATHLSWHVRDRSLWHSRWRVLPGLDWSERRPAKKKKKKAARDMLGVSCAPHGAAPDVRAAAPHGAARDVLGVSCAPHGAAPSVRAA